MDEKPFSEEYDLGSATDSSASETEVAVNEEADEMRKRIEIEYALAKPRRRLIRARIIPR